MKTLLDRAVAARGAAFARVREMSHKTNSKTTLSAPERLHALASSARAFSQELLDARQILVDLESLLETRLASTGEDMHVEHVALQRKLEYVRGVVSDMFAGKYQRRIETLIAERYFEFYETQKVEQGQNSSRAPPAVVPLPHERRPELSNATVAPTVADASKPSSTTNSARAERIIAELGVQLGVQRHDVCALELDQCDCGAPMLRSINKSLMVCSAADCGHVKRIVETTAAGPGVDDADAAATSTRRSTSIKDFISKWQATDRVDIPQAMMSRIARFIYYDLNVRHESSISYRHVICAIFELKLSKDLFDCASQIWSELTGQPPPSLTYNETYAITSIWRIIQDRFSAISANHSKCFFFPLIVERFARLMRFDHVIDFLVPVYTRPSDAATYHAIQSIFEERKYNHIPPPHVYFPGDPSTITVRKPIPSAKLSLMRMPVSKSIDMTAMDDEKHDKNEEDVDEKNEDDIEK